MYIDVIFHSPDLPAISPVVTVWWTKKLVRLLHAVAPRILGDVPASACADFLGACFALPGIDTHRLEVHNLPYPRAWLETDRCAGSLWYQQLMADIHTWPNRPVLWNMDRPYDVSLGGVEIWRWLPREVSPHEPR